MHPRLVLFLALLTIFSCRKEENYDLNGEYQATFYRIVSGNTIDTSYFNCEVIDHGFQSIEIDTIPYWPNTLHLLSFEENLEIVKDSLSTPAISLGGAVWGTHYKIIEGEGFYNPVDESINLHYIIWHKPYSYGTSIHAEGELVLTP